MPLYFSPVGEVHHHLTVQPGVVLPWWGEGSTEALLTISAGPNLFCVIAPLACWNLPSSRLDFCSFPLAHGYLPRSALSRLAPQPWQGGLGQVPQPIPTCLPSTKCMGEPAARGPSAYGVGSHSSHQGTFACEWMTGSLLKGGTKRRNVSHSLMASF